MRKIILLVIISFLAVNVFSAPKKLSVFISYCTFFSPKDGSYVETYLAYNGNTVNFHQNNNGLWQGKLEVLVLFKQNDSIKAFRKFNLFTPEMKDTIGFNMMFHDQQRISVPNGEYSMEISIKDSYGTEPSIAIAEPLTINYVTNEIQISGIELLQSAEKSTNPGPTTKASFDLLSLPLNIYPSMENKLLFYTEMYNMLSILGDSSKFLFRTYVEEMQTSRKIPGLLFQKRMDSENVEAILHEFDITSLPTGDYFLVVEIKDRENNLIAVNRMYFERWNDRVQELTMVDDTYVASSFVNNINQIDTLKEYIRCLRPISTEMEKSFVDKNLKSDLPILQRFFLNFWMQRDDNNPESAWISYYKEVIKVNANFGTKIRKGYETDRGRVYLMYGEPNSITSVPHESAAYPYEIWHYYSINTQPNRKFIFCNSDLVTNDYELIHSDVSGEIYDPNWKSKLLKRNFTTNSLDEQNPDFGWGSQVDDYFNTPH
jgi:GWxTD domain-containing protein